MLGFHRSGRGLVSYHVTMFGWAISNDMGHLQSVRWGDAPGTNSLLRCPQDATLFGTQRGLTIYSIPWNDCVYECAPDYSYMIFFRSTKLAILLIAATFAFVTPTELSGSPAYDQWPVNWEAYQKLWLKDFLRATPDEAVLGDYSEEKAKAFLDNASLKWARQNRCGTCHTTVSYLMARPLIGDAGDRAAWNEVRGTVSEFASESIAKHSPIAAFLAASTAAALAVGDASIGRTLQPGTRALFNYLWASQASDGAWTRPKVETCCRFSSAIGPISR
jgi:hypothetical protein